MNKARRVICVAVATLVVSASSLANAAPGESIPQFPGHFSGCGARGSGAIPTTGCVIVLNRTRGWLAPGDPTFSGGFTFTGSRITAVVTGGSFGWIGTNTQSATAASAPVVGPRSWAGGFCRTGFSNCSVRTEWSIGGATPVEAAIRLRQGDTLLVANEHTRRSGASNTGDSTGNGWVSLTQAHLITGSQNGRYDAVASNYTVRVTVKNRVRDQRLQLGTVANTNTAVEDTRARMPQSQNGFGWPNGSLVLAPQVGNNALSAGRGEYGFVTRVANDVLFRLPFVWTGIPGIDPNGNTANVSIDFVAGALRHDNDRSTCGVLGSNAPLCRIHIDAADANGAHITVTFYDR